MTLTAAELAALLKSTQQIGVFFRLATDPIVRIWFGIGKIEPGVNALDLTGAVYKGFGELGNIPAFRQLLNGAAERVDFTLSGVSPEILAIAMSEADTVKNVDCDLGFGVMGPTWQLLGPIRWTRHFIADFLSVNEQESEFGVTRTVILSVGTLMTGRKRVGLSYMADADQQRRSPGDKFFERVASYAQETTKTWPLP